MQAFNVLRTLKLAPKMLKHFELRNLRRYIWAAFAIRRCKFFSIHKDMFQAGARFIDWSSKSIEHPSLHFQSRYNCTPTIGTYEIWNQILNFSPRTAQCVFFSFKEAKWFKTWYFLRESYFRIWIMIRDVYSVHLYVDTFRRLEGAMLIQHEVGVAVIWAVLKLVS